MFLQLLNTLTHAFLKAVTAFWVDLARQSMFLILFINTVWLAQHVHWSDVDVVSPWHFLELLIASLIILRQTVIFSANAVLLYPSSLVVLQAASIA